MNYYAIQRTNSYLAHFGIKGMHWGVRRYQNPDGTRINKQSKRAIRKAEKQQAKEEKLKRKQLRNTLYNMGIDYGDEFDRTPQGKKLKSRYFAEQDKLFDPTSDNDWGRTTEAKFSKAERDYLRTAEVYAGKKILNEVGEETFIAMLKADGTRIEKGKSLVDCYADSMWVRHQI